MTHTCRRDAKTPCQDSEIRLVRARHSGMLSGEISIRVFGADHFRPLAQRAPIAYGRRPGFGEDAFIRDGEFELQPLALVIRVAYKTRISSEAGKLSLAAFFRFFRGFVIE